MHFWYLHRGITLFMTDSSVSARVSIISSCFQGFAIEDESVFG